MNLLQPSPDVLYIYMAAVVRIVDGDTLVADIDLGFELSMRHTLRLLNIDAPEMHAPDAGVRLAAIKATSELGRMIAGRSIYVRTHKSDSFGRYLAEVWTLDGIDVNQHMLDGGFAAPYARAAPAPSPS